MGVLRKAVAVAQGQQQTDGGDLMCSGCGGDVEDDDLVLCTDCDDEYLSSSPDIETCHKCEQPVCVDCRKAHADNCAGNEDCLS